MSENTATLVGKNPQFLKSLETAKHVAVTKTPVLIAGEAGTGKKAVAQFIHNHSARQSRPIQFVDCKLEPAEVEKKVLGFREADGRFQRGVLEVANGGSVVFQDIDQLDEQFQKRLFTIFQELPDYELDVRLIATTTRSLSKLVGAGKFSRQLWMFFSNAQIEIPALKERAEDISELAQACLKNLNEVNEDAQKMFSSDSIEYLTHEKWGRNISELFEAIRSAYIRTEEAVLDPIHFEEEESAPMAFAGEVDEDGVKLMSLREAEKLLIRKALVFTAENRTQAAKILGVSIRTLRNKINEYRTEGSQYFINLR
jgi:two-component system response regulator FlrC